MPKRLLMSLALVSLCAGGARAADSFATEWAATQKSQARLIAGGPRQAGFEIQLAPGAITYWRNPGDAGAPPDFDFSGSVNLAHAEVQYPAPKRIAEPDGSEAFGYDNDVVFAIDVEAADRSKPVRLTVKASYAVCEKICLPARANLALTLPESGATAYAAPIGAASALTPKIVDWGALGGEILALDASNWRLCLPASSGPARDLFLEAPSGWWFSGKAEGQAAGRDCFAVALQQKPADGAFPVAIRATFTGGAGPIDATLSLAPKS
jgi:hypothetical protein